MADMAWHKACLALVRGEFARGILLSRKMREDPTTRPFGLCMQVVGSVGLGDIQVFDEVVNTTGTGLDSKGLAPLFLRLFLGEQGGLPAWFEQLDFGCLPREERFVGGCLGVRLLVIREEWVAAYAGAAALLNFCEHEPLMNLFRAWLQLVCAISLENQGLREAAFERYRQSVRLAWMLDITLPFLDQPLGPRTLLEQVLSTEAPALLVKIRRQSPGYFRNFLKFRNRFSGERREELLSPRETQLAHLLMADYGYKQIAERLGVSFPRVRNLISALYEKLGIHRRAEIPQRVW